MKILVNLPKTASDPDPEKISTKLFNSLKAFFAGSGKEGKWYSGLAIAGMIALLLLIICLIHHENKTVSQLSYDTDRQAQIILNQVGNIDSELRDMTKSNDSTAIKQHLSDINNQLLALKESINILASTSDVKKISTQLTGMKADVDSQLLDVKKAVIYGSENKDYVDPSMLPFQVISLDVISEEPFASIDYDHHITPLTVGDSLAGWQMTSVDYDAGIIEFKNENNKYIKIALQG